jgi:hypothetical protein
LGFLLVGLVHHVLFLLFRLVHDVLLLSFALQVALSRYLHRRGGLWWREQ